MNDIEPKHAGDFCPKDHSPVRRVPLVLKSPSVRSYALYCDLCEPTGRRGLSQTYRPRKGPARTSCDPSGNDAYGEEWASRSRGAEDCGH